ncbi:phage antirepressor [Luteimicrobium sp. NPDC057192]|uniref:phage antirepressor n=1 Tax=Luteimicrobium sp. NPDC057192 TaxID=3346042 RepID=UPI00363A515C
MNELSHFNFHGAGVRVLTDEHGEPWFVLADLVQILGLNSKPSQVAARLAGDQKGVRVTDTLGGRQNVAVVNESGMWTVVLRSDSPAAEPVRRWVTDVVLPSIRKTGQYGAPATLTGPELMAAALIEAHKVIEDRDAKVAALAPRAQAWDVMVSAAGDYAVDEAAKILSRDPDIEIGRNRLFNLLSELGWIYRQGARNRWHAYQTAVQTGRLVERMSSAFLNSRTGQMEAPAPTIRITPKGLDDLRARLLPRRLEVVAG